jgi:hypothetical protein
MTVPGPRRVAGTKGKTRWQCEQRGVGRLGSGRQGILDGDVVEVLGALAQGHVHRAAAGSRVRGGSGLKHLDHLHVAGRN